jgi:hypothetical protein
VVEELGQTVSDAVSERSERDKENAGIVAEPIAALSWILELPQDLGLPEDNFAAVVADGSLPTGWSDDPELVPGWKDHALPVLFDRRLKFRRVLVNVGMPTASTDLAFGDLKGYSGRMQRKYERGLKKLIKRGVEEWKTVCQLTRWYVGEAIPDPPESALVTDAQSPIRLGFDQLLADLDIWLQQYGMSAGNFNVGSISLHDLPALIPWNMEFRADPETRAFIQGGMLHIHAKTPNLVPAEGDDEAARSASIAVAKPEDLPFFTPFTLLFQAQAHALAGRSRSSLVDVGTAVEAMVAIVVAESLRQTGRRDEIEEIVEKSRWKDLFNKVLLEALNLKPGEGPSIHSRWWSKHYKSRNRAVHQGARLSASDAFAAVDDTWSLFDWIGETMRSIDHLAGLGAHLIVKRK